MMRGAARTLLACVALLAMPAAFADPITQPAKPGEYAALASLPDWSGAWQPDWSGLFASRAASVPVLLPEPAKKLAAFEEGKKRGENLQTELANCVPPGMPQIMRMPYPMEFLFTPGRVTLNIETESQVRRIYTDGRPLPDDPDPYFNGWSVGHWEGDTLIVDTNGLNPKTSLVPGVHPSEKATIREKMHLVSPDKLSIETTITDPLVLAKPLVLTTNYIRKRDWQIKEYVCQENNHDKADEFGRPSFELEKK
jgi:hypothetical protein